MRKECCEGLQSSTGVYLLGRMDKFLSYFVRERGAGRDQSSALLEHDRSPFHNRSVATAFETGAAFLASERVSLGIGETSPVRSRTEWFASSILPFASVHSNHKAIPLVAYPHSSSAALGGYLTSCSHSNLRFSTWARYISKRAITDS